jgi:Ca2+-transporting ATPase
MTSWPGTLPAQQHTLSPEETARILAVVPGTGLDQTEAQRRLGLVGENLMRAPCLIPTWRVLRGQFESLMVALLAIAAAVALSFGQTTEAAAILVVLVLNAAIGFTTELKAVRSIEALRKLGVQQTIVRCNGATRRIRTAARGRFTRSVLISTCWATR